jgi:hypothetical protein
MREATMQQVGVLFYERSKCGFREMYKHTFKQRRSLSGVFEDIAEGYQMALEHANSFQCPADVYQGKPGPLGHTLLEIREQSPFPVSDDGWEPWQGAGGQRHEAFRWAD